MTQEGLWGGGVQESHKGKVGFPNACLKCTWGILGGITIDGGKKTQS